MHCRLLTQYVITVPRWVTKNKIDSGTLFVDEMMVIFDYKTILRNWAK